MTNIILRDQEHKFLENISVKYFERFIFYRGRLFEQTGKGEYTYTQRQYVEIS